MDVNTLKILQTCQGFFVPLHRAHSGLPSSGGEGAETSFLFSVPARSRTVFVTVISQHQSGTTLTMELASRDGEDGHVPRAT